MTAPIIRAPTMDDCEYIAAHMRADDRREIFAMDGSLPLEAIVESLEASVHCRVMEHGGVPFVIYGLCPSEIRKGQGVSWLLGTDDLSNHSMWFLRNCRGLLDDLHDYFPVYGNHADLRNTVHINWLRWSGFTFGNTIEHGGTHFIEHWRTR